MVKNFFKFILLIVLLYFFISILIGQNNYPNRTHYFYTNWEDYSNNRLDAEFKGILLNNKFKIKILSDSLNIIKNIDFWISKRVIHNKYGLFIHFIDTANDYCDLNLLYKNSTNEYLCFTEQNNYNSGYECFDSLRKIKLIMRLPNDETTISFFNRSNPKSIKRVGQVHLQW